MESPVMQMRTDVFTEGQKEMEGDRWAVVKENRIGRGTRVGVGGVRPAALKFIIHLHSPKHALEAIV